MAHIIIDRRKNDKGKNTDNRHRFVRRVKQQVREAVKKTISGGNIEDITSDKGKKVNISGKGLKQPSFQHNKSGGVFDRVFPGNEDFNQGDRIPRPKDGAGKTGKEGSADGQGEDDFAFNLTQDEFLDFFFEDLELPDLVKKDIVKTEEFEYKRAGFTVDGNPSRMNLVRSMKQAKGRRFGLRAPKKKKIKKLEEELTLLTSQLESTASTDEKSIKRLKKQIVEIENKLANLYRQIKKIPFIDDMDLRFNRWERVPIPTTQAVMFGIMDVSGSMGEWEKEMAKRFFMLMYLFLTRNYERVDIVWIRHHSIAAEVDEQEFFYSKETGGTIVSSALQLMDEIIQERYPLNNWNIFGCQISDGDNWSGDNVAVIDLMQQSILPKSQYFAYVEVDQYDSSYKSDLWPHYQRLQGQFKNLEMAVINDVTQIFPLFKKLFEKRGKS